MSPKIPLLGLFLLIVLSSRSFALSDCAIVGISIVTKTVQSEDDPNKVFIYADQCSATFVSYQGKAYLATAYHCIYLSDDNRVSAPQDISINENAACSNDHLESVKVKQILVHPMQLKITRDFKREFKTPMDIALLETDINNQEFALLPKMELLKRESKVEGDVTLNYAGFPVEPPYEIGDFKSNVNVEAFVSRELNTIFLFDTVFGGMSGGPIYISKENRKFLLGIVSTSTREQSAEGIMTIKRDGEGALLYQEDISKFVSAAGKESL